MGCGLPWLEKRKQKHKREANCCQMIPKSVLSFSFAIALFWSLAIILWTISLWQWICEMILPKKIKEGKDKGSLVHIDQRPSSLWVSHEPRGSTRTEACPWLEYYEPTFLCAETTAWLMKRILCCMTHCFYWMERRWNPMWVGDKELICVHCAPPTYSGSSFSVRGTATVGSSCQLAGSIQVSELFLCCCFIPCKDGRCGLGGSMWRAQTSPFR